MDSVRCSGGSSAKKRGRKQAAVVRYISVGLGKLIKVRNRCNNLCSRDDKRIINSRDVISNVIHAAVLS